MTVNCLLPLVLDLSETGARIHTTAYVVWAESSGRTGIRFPELPEVSLEELKKWMAVNEAKTNGAGDGTGETAEDSDAPAAVETPPALPDPSLIAERAEIQRDVERFGPNLKGALERIAERAAALTWAGGSAIALQDEDNSSQLICVARAGRESPELGARRDPKSGFSGECIRSGTALRCDDTETDPRDGARDFHHVGIRSLVACPIRTLKGEVLGILEVFSREPGAFRENDAQTLEGLALLAANAVGHVAGLIGKPLPVMVENPQPAPGSVDTVPGADRTDKSEAGIPVSTRHTVLYGAGICALLLSAWLAGTRFSAAMHSRTVPAPPPQAPAAAAQTVDYAGLSTAELKKAALAGDGAAQYALGIRYAGGEGVGADYHQALGWFLKAADSGELRAASKIASCFWAGRGTEQDYSKAYFWGLLAQAAGDDTVRVIVADSSPHLRDSQRLAEKQEADAWLRAHRPPASGRSQ